MSGTAFDWLRRGAHRIVQIDGPVHAAILRAAGASMAVRIIGLGLSYAANVLLSRLLGVQAYGEYVIALSWALVLTLPAKAGFDNSALRYSSVYLDRDDPAKLRGFIRFAAATVSLISVAIALLVLVAGSHLMPVGERTRVWAALLVPPLALLSLFSVLLRTARRIVAAQFYEQVLRPALIIAGLAAAIVAGIAISASSAMALTTIAAATALLVLLIQLGRVLRSANPAAPRYDEWRQWIAVSVPMLMLGVVQELMNQIDIILLGQIADARQAALFAASWRLASLVPFALVGLAVMSGPLIAAAHDRGSTEEMHRISSIVARAGFAFAVVGALLLLVFGKALLGLFGDEFVAAVPVLGILLLGGVVNAFTGVVAYYMTLTGHERQALLIFVGALALSIGLNVWLIPRYGAVGSAVASSSALAAWNLAMLAYVRRTIGIDASALALAPARREMTD
jgi:O-antigen/teichoic acid export membrane protein